MARYFFHIRVAQVFDVDYDGVDIRADDSVAEAVAIARRMVAELLAHDEAVNDMTFEITDCEGMVVAELPFHCCARLQ